MLITPILPHEHKNIQDALLVAAHQEKIANPIIRPLLPDDIGKKDWRWDYTRIYSFEVPSLEIIAIMGFASEAPTAIAVYVELDRKAIITNYTAIRSAVVVRESQIAKLEFLGEIPERVFLIGYVGEPGGKTVC